MVTDTSTLSNENVNMDAPTAPPVDHVEDDNMADASSPSGLLYSSGQLKPTYFEAVGIPIWNMTGTPPEAQKCWETFI
jgi:hypothetical protein